MRGTFDPKKDYAIGDVVWDGVDANGDGIYFEVKTSHLGEWKTGEVVTSGETVFKDGKLYEAVNNLTASSNNEANFSSNWNELGTPPNPPTASLLSSMTVGTKPTNVSPTVKSEATTTTNTLNNKYFKEVSTTTNPVSVYLPTGLIEMGYAPDDVQLKSGQYLHDTINNQYFVVKSNATLSLTDTTINSSNISASLQNLVALQKGQMVVFFFWVITCLPRVKSTFTQWVKSWKQKPVIISMTQIIMILCSQTKCLQTCRVVG